jgi:hypothetical protein
MKDSVADSVMVGGESCASAPTSPRAEDEAEFEQKIAGLLEKINFRFQDEM